MQWTHRKWQMPWSYPRWKTRSGSLYRVVPQQEKDSSKDWLGCRTTSNHLQHRRSNTHHVYKSPDNTIMPSVHNVRNRPTSLKSTPCPTRSHHSTVLPLHLFGTVCTNESSFHISPSILAAIPFIEQGARLGLRAYYSSWIQNSILSVRLHVARRIILLFSLPHYTHHPPFWLPCIFDKEVERSRTGLRGDGMVRSILWGDFMHF